MTTDVPRLSLATLPTRVHRLTGLSEEAGREVWVKRDDESSTSYGGNKVRKLEFLLAAAKSRGHESIWTLGAYGSHHAFATAWYARAAGFEPHALLFPQPMSPKDCETLRATASLADVRRLPPTSRSLLADAAAVLRMSLSPRVAWIPGGGSSPIGTVGFVEAAFEFADQIHRGDCPKPQAVFVPFGSSGTAAGLALGFALKDLDITVVGVRVVPLPVSSRPATLALIARALHVIRGTAQSIRDARYVAQAAKLLRLDDTQLGAGYAHPTEAAHEAVATAQAQGLALETTYTAKAFAAFLTRASNASRNAGPILFWQTFAGRLPAISTPRSVPDWVLSVSS
ncbi:MAG: pyridoxal-phosphate dependent enzyme [Deltaproteobacteria bacterium]|nr:pyridoxal-phosphate dependent enzyme [Deltaproteobacteria bacterium]